MRVDMRAKGGGKGRGVVGKRVNMRGEEENRVE